METLKGMEVDDVHGEKAKEGIRAHTHGKDINGSMWSKAAMLSPVVSHFLGFAYTRRERSDWRGEGGRDQGGGSGEGVVVLVLRTIKLVFFIFHRTLIVLSSYGIHASSLLKPLN